MSNNETISKEETKSPPSLIGKKRKVYTKPYLKDMGDLRTTTLGPSPGLFESGAGDSVYKNELG